MPRRRLRRRLWIERCFWLMAVIGVGALVGWQHRLTQGGEDTVPAVSVMDQIHARVLLVNEVQIVDEKGTMRMALMAVEGKPSLGFYRSSNGRVPELFLALGERSPSPRREGPPSTASGWSSGMAHAFSLDRHSLATWR